MNPLDMWFTIPELAINLRKTADAARNAMAANNGPDDVGELADAAAAAAEALERFADLVNPSYDGFGRAGETTPEDLRSAFDDFMFSGVPPEFREFLAPRQGATEAGRKRRGRPSSRVGLAD